MNDRAGKKKHLSTARGHLVRRCLPAAAHVHAPCPPPNQRPMTPVRSQHHQPSARLCSTGHIHPTSTRFSPSRSRPRPDPDQRACLGIAAARRSCCWLLLLAAAAGCWCWCCWCCCHHHTRARPRCAGGRTSAVGSVVEPHALFPTASNLRRAHATVLPSRVLPERAPLQALDEALCRRQFVPTQLSRTARPRYSRSRPPKRSVSRPNMEPTRLFRDVSPGYPPK